MLSRSRNLVVVLMVLFLAVKDSKAQMGEAQPMKFDKDTTVRFDQSISSVWKLVQDPAKWSGLSNGYISSISTKGDLSTKLRRSITFADGSTRTDDVTQFMPEYRFIVNSVIAPIPAGVTENIYMFSLSLDEQNKTVLKYSIKVDGAAEGKKQLLETLEKEMRIFIQGVQNAVIK